MNEENPLMIQCLGNWKQNSDGTRMHPSFTPDGRFVIYVKNNDLYATTAYPAQQPFVIEKIDFQSYFLFCFFCFQIRPSFFLFSLFLFYYKKNKTLRKVFLKTKNQTFKKGGAKAIKGSESNKNEETNDNKPNKKREGDIKITFNVNAQPPVEIRLTFAQES